MFIDTDSVKMVNGNIFATIKGGGNIAYYKINPYSNKYILLYFEEFDENKYKSDNNLKYDVNNPNHYHAICTDEINYIRERYCPSCPKFTIEKETLKNEVKIQEQFEDKYYSYFTNIRSTIYHNWEKPQKLNDNVRGFALIRIYKDGTVATFILRKPISAIYKQSIIDAIKKSKFDPLPESMNLDFLNVPIFFPL